jgi:hypothetical protein
VNRADPLLFGSCNGNVKNYRARLSIGGELVTQFEKILDRAGKRRDEPRNWLPRLGPGGGSLGVVCIPRAGSRQSHGKYSSTARPGRRFNIPAVFAQDRATDA